MVLAALGIAIIMACLAEVASEFSEPGGPYLYVRTAFGRFLGMQVGWFHLLADVAGVAGCAVLFANYLTVFLRSPLNAWQRASLIAIVIAIPAVANCLGVRSGANLSRQSRSKVLLDCTKTWRTVMSCESSLQMESFKLTSEMAQSTCEQ